MKNALVLLSGGMDSVAALHWARENFDRVESLLFDYGQANRDGELPAAGMACARRNVFTTMLHLGDAVRGYDMLQPAEPGMSDGVSRAFLPGRNMIFLSVAAAHAARRYGPDGCTLVVGANADDFAGFPDCRPMFFSAVQTAVAAWNRDGWITIATPWTGKTKAEILGWAKDRPEALEDVRASVSCYAGKRCGTCDPCTLRAAAFAAHGLEDGASVPKMRGGDPAREAKLRVIG